jgi:hypothetical protein
MDPEVVREEGSLGSQSVPEKAEVREKSGDGEKDHRAGGGSVSVVVQMPTLSAKVTAKE